MCHTIEDPTFDATAVATNARAQVRPLHRPPRVPAGRQPHCAWTVVIDESYPPVEGIPALDIVSETRAATWELDAIDRSDDGLADYSGPVVSDFDFSAYSHSALVRMADEVCLQMHLLYLSFAIAVRARAGSDTNLADSVCTRQLIGVAGLGAERIHRALSLPSGIAGVLKVLELHPLLNPIGYINAEIESGLRVHQSPAHDDAAWISLCSPESVQPLQAIAAAIDPRIDVKVSGSGTEWIAEFAQTDTAATELPEVAIAKVSGGSTFEFQPRKSLPLTVV
jgi:hypothetical protein